MRPLRAPRWQTPRPCQRKGCKRTWLPSTAQGAWAGKYCSKECCDKARCARWRALRPHPPWRTMRRCSREGCKRGYLPKVRRQLYCSPRCRGRRLLRQVEALVVERDEALEAWRALLSDLESANGDWPGRCDAPRCRRLATCNDGDQIACDEHQGMLVAGDIEDLSYAASLRRLRELLEKGQTRAEAAHG